MKFLLFFLFFLMLFPGKVQGFIKDLSIEFIDLKITNMPLEIRDVSPHPDDYRAITKPIERTEYDVKKMATLGIPLKEYEFFSLNLRHMFYPSIAPSLKMEKQYYENHPSYRARGAIVVGTDVRGIIPGTSSPVINFFTNISPEIVFSVNRWSLSISYFELVAYNGWDREELEINKYYSLGKIFPIGLTYDIEQIDLYVSLKYLHINKTEWGKKAEINDSHFSFGVGVRF